MMDSETKVKYHCPLEEFDKEIPAILPVDCPILNNRLDDIGKGVCVKCSRIYD